MWMTDGISRHDNMADASFDSQPKICIKSGLKSRMILLMSDV